MLDENKSDLKSCSCCNKSINIRNYDYVCNDCFEKDGIMNTLKTDKKINQRIEAFVYSLMGIIVALMVMMVWHWSGR